MTIFIFANQAKTVLAADCAFTDTVVIVAPSTGSVFPTPTSGQIVELTLSSAENPAITEIVYCTNIVGDTLTIVRAQENTVARNWKKADFIANLFTSGTADNFVQIMSGTTAQRPIPTKIGQIYYDTTLGYSINCHQFTPSVIWHNGQGVSV